LLMVLLFCRDWAPESGSHRPSPPISFRRLLTAVFAWFCGAPAGPQTVQHHDTWRPGSLAVGILVGRGSTGWYMGKPFTAISARGGAGESGSRCSEASKEVQISAAPRDALYSRGLCTVLLHDRSLTLALRPPSRSRWASPWPLRICYRARLFLCCPRGILREHAPGAQDAPSLLHSRAGHTWPDSEPPVCRLEASRSRLSLSFLCWWRPFSRSVSRTVRFFPARSPPSGQLFLRFRAPVGTRVETTGRRLTLGVLDAIQRRSRRGECGRKR